MHNLALKEAEKHVLFQHESAEGWVTIAKKDIKSGRFRQYHYQPEELAAHLTEWLGEDVYFSQNTFFRPQRRIDTIRQLRSLYVDLDVYNKGLEPEWVLRKLELETFGQTMPDPNLVIFSGRGLVLIWNIEPIPYMGMPLWKSVENYFIKQLEEVGSDAKASDPTRIFRLAGSVNSKSGTMVETEYRHTYRYELRQIQYDYLPELEPKKLQQKKPGRKSKVVWLFNVYTLHIARARDIARLVELRGGDCGGFRETILFLYRYYTCCYSQDPDKALADTLDLNSEFTRPLLEREVKRATNSAEKAWKAKSADKANEIAKSMGFPGAGYNIKNAKIIEWLQITPWEQEHLETIIDANEKRRRKRIKDRAAKEQQRREAGMKTMAEYNAVRGKKVKDKATVLRELLEEYPKLSNRKIAKEMGISEAYVRKLKAKL